MSKDDKNPGEKNTEKSGSSSRLGREAKIGVAVILILLVVLGVVVVRKFAGGTPDESLAAIAEKEKEKGKHEGEARTDPFNKDGKSKLFGGAQATVVPAKTASAKPPRSSDRDRDQWKIASDKPEPRRYGDAGAAMTPPSFMPEPPNPPAAESAGRYGSNNAKSASDDPLNRYAAQPPLPPRVDDDPSRDAGTPNALRAIEADRHARRYGDAGNREPAEGDRADSGFASAESSPGAKADSREAPRYGEMVPPAPSLAARKNAAFSPASEHSAQGKSIVPRGIGEDRDTLATPSSYGSHDLRRAGSSSAHVAPVARREDGKYEVQPNDSYYVISEKLYGTGAYFKALAEHNRGKGLNADQLKPGDMISTPTLAQLEQTYPDLCPKASHRETLQSKTATVSTRNQYRSGRTYTVAEGDTLFNIARYELGKAARWVEIYELNRDVLGKDFNYLTPGTQLSLPQDEKTDVLTRQPGSTYRR